MIIDSVVIVLITSKALILMGMEECVFPLILSFIFIVFCNL